MLTEWKRVLKPGGKLILELPCMDKVFSYIASKMNAKEPLAMHMVWNPLWGGLGHNKSPAMVHKWGYTVGQIKALLREVGFTDIKLEEARYHFPERDMRVVGFKP